MTVDSEYLLVEVEEEVPVNEWVDLFKYRERVLKSNFMGISPGLCNNVNNNTSNYMF